VVDDFEAWRRFFCSTLQQHARFEITGEVSDGMEAVQQAQQQQPDLILLDIGLPTLNGIEAARRIREVSPTSKILFVSEHRSADIVEEALSMGAGGYVLKSVAAGELLPAIDAVLEGERFVSVSLNGPANQHTNHPYPDVTSTAINRHHAAGFYSADGVFVDHGTQFIAAALKAGKSVIVVATESHRESIHSQLQAKRLDIVTAIKEGRYIPMDAADALSMVIKNGILDPVRFLELLGGLIMTAADAAKDAHGHVAVFGECAHLLCSQGNIEAAIQMEKLGNKLTEIHSVDILCGYAVDRTVNAMDSHTFEQICAEHSFVHSF